MGFKERSKIAKRIMQRINAKIKMKSMEAMKINNRQKTKSKNLMKNSNNWALIGDMNLSLRKSPGKNHKLCIHRTIKVPKNQKTEKGRKRATLEVRIKNSLKEVRDRAKMPPGTSYTIVTRDRIQGLSAIKIMRDPEDSMWMTPVINMKTKRAITLHNLMNRKLSNWKTMDSLWWENRSLKKMFIVSKAVLPGEEIGTIKTDRVDFIRY